VHTGDWQDRTQRLALYSGLNFPSRVEMCEGRRRGIFRQVELLTVILLRGLERYRPQESRQTPGEARVMSEVFRVFIARAKHRESEMHYTR